MEERNAALLRRITGVGFDIHSDYPDPVQVEHAEDGVLQFSEYEESEDGYFIHPPSNWDGTFADVLEQALACGTWELDIRGLSDKEAFDLVTSSTYRDALIELASRSELDNRVFRVNGVGFASFDGELFATVRLAD